MMVQSQRNSVQGARSAKQRLLSGAALAMVIAFGGGVQRADAQSLQGSPTATQGTLTISGTATNTIYALSAPQTIIDWRSKDSGVGDFIFQSAGTTATFQNDAASLFSNFVVLNRILPSDVAGSPTANRAVQINGTINSRIIIPGTPAVRGGSVWFYTPGGLIIGNGALLDVGNLVLSASDIDPTSLFTGSNGTIRFTGVQNPNAAISIANGAAINAGQSGSYVAAFAPRVAQSGTVSTNGSTAYIAAEQADVSINQGLFDIAFAVGTGAKAMSNKP
jgi:filamentous hemagglutinin family protein